MLEGAKYLEGVLFGYQIKSNLNVVLYLHTSFDGEWNNNQPADFVIVSLNVHGNFGGSHE